MNSLVVDPVEVVPVVDVWLVVDGVVTVVEEVVDSGVVVSVLVVLSVDWVVVLTVVPVVVEPEAKTSRKHVYNEKSHTKTIENWNDQGDVRF